MALIDIQKLVNSGVTIPEINFNTEFSFSIRRNKLFIRQFILSNNDTVSTIIELLTADVVNLKISFYSISGTVVKPLSSTTMSDWTLSFNKEFTAGQTIVFEIESKYEITGKGMLKVTNFSPVAFFNFKIQNGHWISGFDIVIKRKPVECHENLSYELIEGELPDGLRLTVDGRLVGIGPNLDCLEDTENLSPSFNWFYSNNDGHTQAWAKQWRFKLKVSITSQPDVYYEEWFCIKVYNNWSYDRDNFDDQQLTEHTFTQATDIKLTAIEQLELLCPVDFVEPFVPEDITKQEEVKINYEQIVKCYSCNDPTRKRYSEEYDIPIGHKIRSPHELIKFYINNKNNYDILIMNLHNSEILPKIIESMNDDSINKTETYEIKINDNKITLIKYVSTEDRSFTDVDDILISIRNTENQSLPTSPFIYQGEIVEAILTW